MGRRLGDGRYGTVRLVEKKNYDRIRFAMKQMTTDEESIEFQQREYDVLKKLDHPFLSNIVEVYYSSSDRKLQLIQPLYEGGDLGTLIQSDSLPESDVCRIIWQALLALNYMHKHGLVHRDLKPDNLTFERHTKGLSSFIRIIDFGFAVDLNDKTLDITADELIHMGTPYYMAPEVVNRQTLTHLSDMWALGVTTYALLCGYPPFAKAKTTEELFDLINTNNYDYDSKDWSSVSDQAKNFIEKLIQPSLNLRFSAE